MAVNTTDWSQPTTTVGTATIYDSATAYDTSAYYDGIYTIPSIQAVSTSWAVACLVGIGFGAFIAFAFVVGGVF